MGNIITLLTIAVIYFIANQYINKKINGEGGDALFEMDNQENCGEEEVNGEAAQSVEVKAQRPLFTNKRVTKKRVVNQVVNTTPIPKKIEVKEVESHISKPSELSLKNQSRKELRKAVIMSEVLNQKF